MTRRDHPVVHMTFGIAETAQSLQTSFETSNAFSRKRVKMDLRGVYGITKCCCELLTMAMEYSSWACSTWDGCGAIRTAVEYFGVLNAESWFSLWALMQVTNKEDWRRPCLSLGFDIPQLALAILDFSAHKTFIANPYPHKDGIHLLRLVSISSRVLPCLYGEQPFVTPKAYYTH